MKYLSFTCLVLNLELVPWPVKANGFGVGGALGFSFLCRGGFAGEEAEDVLIYLVKKR